MTLRNIQARFHQIPILRDKQTINELRQWFERMYRFFRGPVFSAGPKKHKKKNPKSLIYSGLGFKVVIPTGFKPVTF